MKYETDCECGRVVTVKATDAGATVACRCGRKLDVPSLSQLRQIAPPRPQGPPPADYSHLRIPGFIVAIVGILLALFLGFAGEGRSPLVSLFCYAIQIVGVTLICISKRYPVWLCLILSPLGCCGLILSLFLPERLPPAPPTEKD
jgi:hypothetical protein